MKRLQTWKKYFSPIPLRPFDYIMNSLEALMLAAYAIFSMEITRNILSAIEVGNPEKLRIGLYTFFGVTLAVTIIRFTLFIKTGWNHITGNGRKILIDSYLSKYLRADGNAVERIGTGRFISTLETGIYTWLNQLYALTYMGVQQVVFCIYAMVIVFHISLTLGAAILVLFILTGMAVNRVNFFITERRYLRRDAEKEATHNAAIVLMSKNEFMQNTAGYEALVAKYRKNMDDSMGYQIPVNTGFIVMQELPQLVFAGVRVILYFFMAQHIWEGSASIADLAIFIAIMAVAEKSVQGLMDLFRNLLKDFSSVSLLWKTFDELPEITGYEEGDVFTLKKGRSICLQNISYGYTTGTPVLHDLSLEFEYGKKTALVGGSGAGKTTLMKLVAGYIRPDSGAVNVCGNPLSRTALKTYFPHIGYLTQDPSVFDGTIRENLIASTSQEVSDSNIIQALKNAECEFVFDLEQGLDTQIGERGVRLSGGQKQRLAIAKIFLRNPEIILLDEPTSALDSFSEERIMSAMHRLFEGRTVIVIAHRLQTVKSADRILVLESGTVVEDGSHESLLAKKGIYAKMLELQSGF